MPASRRTFIKKTALAVAGTTLLSHELFAATDSKELTGVQLYSVRDDMKKDPLGTLQQLSKMGYKNVEHANYVDRKFYGYSAKEFRKVLDDLGLKMPSGHTVMRKDHWDDAKKEFTDAWKYTVEDAAVMGQFYVISPSMDANLRKNQDELKKFLDVFNKSGELCKKSGMKFGYHNHDFEFSEKFGDVQMYDVILQNTDPKLVIQQLDIGNMYNGGAKALDVMKKWPGMYNNVAWGLSGESLDGEAGDLAMAKDLSGKSLEYMKASMDNPANKPVYYTDKEYRKNLQYSYGMYADTYALILWKSGEQENALKYQGEAIKNMNNGDNEANERFIVYKEKLKGPSAVKDDIEGYVKDGKSSPKLKDILKRAYVAEGHTDAEFGVYLEGLLKEYQVKLREELMKKMINEKAPKFVLKDLAGKTVSLDELKGKVVVVDFWATWCGPCKASFPGMQLALNKYKNDPDVRFVFVDTWESKKVDEMKKNADEFITKNKYSFQVLLDTDDKVISSYAVDGIPTKFVIDTDSKIRFKAVGYDGSADKLVDEISIMVDVLKPGGENGTKKAF